MSLNEPLSPMRLRPLFKTAIWGGTRLRPFLGETSSTEPTGEAWILSDQGDSHSEIVEGSAAGRTLRQLLETDSHRVLGSTPDLAGRFPLLLKFIDAKAPLSVQVHPDDEKARRLEPQSPGIGKTEAWLTLEAEPEAKLYSGLKSGVTVEALRHAINEGTVEPLMHIVPPKPGDCLFLRAGIVHAIGAGAMLFEIQQSSDITYRLFDWNRVDPKTGKSRELHIDKGLACVNDVAGPCNPVTPISHGRREILVDCEFFFLDRWTTAEPFQVGRLGECRMVVCLQGEAELSWKNHHFKVIPGQVWLLPAETGECQVMPKGTGVYLECGGSRG